MTKEILNYINNEIKDDELKNFRTNKLNIQKKKKELQISNMGFNSRFKNYAQNPDYFHHYYLKKL